MADQRDQAERYLREGIIDLGVAFNIIGRRAWQFDEATRARAEELLRELVELFHEGEIEAAWRSDAQVRAHAEVHRRFRRLLAVREDEAFQRFVRRATEDEDGPVGSLHRVLRGAGRSAAAKRTWARRQRRAR